MRRKGPEQCHAASDDEAGNRALICSEVSMTITNSAELMRRRSAAAEGDLFTALPAETGSPLTGRPALGVRNRRGAELAAGV
jgi:hypothetical protein